MIVMYLFYNLILIFLTLAALPYLLWKILTSKRHRFGLSQKLGFTSFNKIAHHQKNKPVWIHAVSVGEVLSTKALIQHLQQKKLKVYLSTTTKAGYDIAQSKSFADFIFFLPFDFPWILNKFFRILNPALIVLIESELWPNLIWMASNRKIPVAVLNCRISKKSQRNYELFSFFYKKLFSKISFFGVQSNELKEFLVNRMHLSQDKVSVIGTLKYDIDIVENQDTRANDHPLIWTAASTHKGEEEICLRVFEKLKIHFPDLNLIIAPRHIERSSEVQKLFSAERKDILLVDKMGEFTSIFSRSTVVFMGKSLISPGGGHNVIEPCAFGKAVVTGPYNDNFKDVVEDFYKNNALFIVRSEAELYEKTKKLLSLKKLRHTLGENALKVIRKRRGVTEKNLKILNRFLGDDSARLNL